MYVTTLQNYWSSDHSCAISLLEIRSSDRDVIIEYNGDRQALQQLIGSSSIVRRQERQGQCL